MRLQRFLAEAGVASRRASETLITGGHVVVNGQTIRQLGSRVDPDADRVTVDGSPVRPRRKLYVALHKPRGYLCSRRDPQQRQTVLDLLPREWSSIYPVGRLDCDSEGLLLLTNDGEFCLRLTHPRYGVPKKYVATVEGPVTPDVTHRLVQGVVHDGDRLRAAHVRILESAPTHTHLEVELREGKNREIRRLFEALGKKVVRLRRTQIGPIRLGELPRGKWRVLTRVEIERLLSSNCAGPEKKIATARSGAGLQPRESTPEGAAPAHPTDPRSRQVEAAARRPVASRQPVRNRES